MAPYIPESEKITGLWDVVKKPSDICLEVPAHMDLLRSCRAVIDCRVKQGTCHQR